MARARSPRENIILAIIYSELTPSGTEAKIWVTFESISNRELTQVGLKSISLMTSDDIDEGDIIHEPRNIIEKDDFSIIPFADQGAIGICYLFNYAPGGKENIQGTISVLFYQEYKNFLFKNHDAIKKVIKFTAFEILKILMQDEPEDDNPEAIRARFMKLHDKILRLKNKEVPSEDATE